MPGRVGTAYRWEVVKLRAQRRTQVVLAACLLSPFVFVFLLDRQDRVPKDSLFGRYVHDSGFATPLLLLGFAAQWVLPLLTSLVAGDIFSSEDQHGTWKTILTRSHTRAQIFWGKTLAASSFAVLVLLSLTVGTTAAGVLLVGHQPLESLVGVPLPAGQAFGLVLAGWATALPPLLGFTALAILVSVLTRSSPAGIVAPVVVGLIMQLYGFLNGASTIRHVLLTTPFDSWHGLLAAPLSFYGPLYDGLVVCAVYISVCLAIAYRALNRRDITGG
jgi:ABC-2 type transport system permease protein